MHLIKRITYMQMLNIKFSAFIGFLFCVISASVSICQANIRFIDQFQVEPVIDELLANKITAYYSEDINLPLKQQRDELLKLDTQLESLSNTHSDSAIFWFLKGLHHKNMASYYSEEKNLPLTKSHMTLNNKAFEKAIKLTELPGNQLSSSIFSTMKHSLPQDLRIEATKNEIKLGGNGDNDSYYWYLHWSNIDQLEKAGREEEAKQAYKKMQRELKASNADMSIYQTLTRKIETETLKLPVQKKTQPQTQKTKPVEKKKEKEKPKVYETKYIVILAVILLSIISIVAVTAYEVLQNRKKK